MAGIIMSGWITLAHSAMAKQQKGPRPRHVPQRTCIACRKVDTKRGLVRLVRQTEGHVMIDMTGKRPGRGAYLCAERGCWETALKRKAVERALKIDSLQEIDRQALQIHLLTLPYGTDDDKAEAAVPAM